MSLNNTQLTTLKTAIQTEPGVATDLANGNYQNIANYFNASAGSIDITGTALGYSLVLCLL